MTSEKNDEPIDFPVNDFDLKDFVKQEQISGTVYDLYGVVNHFGSLNGGHYTATCKNPMEKKWYAFNDSVVYAIEDPPEFDKFAAYLLFYRKRD